MNPLSLIPAPYRLLGGAIAIAATLGALAAWGAHREAAGYRAGQANVQAAWERAKNVALAAALAATDAARAEEQRRAAAHKELLNVADTQTAQARAAETAAAAAGQRLRDRAATLAAACDRPAGHPAAAGPGPAASAPGAVLSDLLGRLEAAGGQLASVADASRIAGQACERSYDSLTPLSAD